MKQSVKSILGIACLLTALLSLFTAGIALSASATEDSPAFSIYDTWVATDALDRETPTHEETGAVREDATVGMFYFMFMDERFDNTEIVDPTAAYEQGGAQAVWNCVVTEGFHIWAEPYFGYYRNTDEWILRKHAYMLTDAGVDFIYLDVTSTDMVNIYQHCWLEIFRVWQEMRDSGIDTPQICFSFGEGTFDSVVWREIYTPDENGNYKYQDLWFMWEGKPLIFADMSTATKEQKDFFTVRKSWAYLSETTGYWPWMQVYPQKEGFSPSGTMEAVSVTAGFHANNSWGRSMLTVDGAQVQTTNGKYDFGYSLLETAFGLAFEQQWSRAHALKPSVVMLTGWNEFTFGKHINVGVGQTMSKMYVVTQDDPIQKNNYIDAFDAEYSRDIEPIKGAFGDNYLYQMASNIRLYKGTNPIPENSASFTVNLSGDLSEFDSVESIYRDTAGDITHRNSTSIGNVFTYINETGRNDLLNAKVSKTEDWVYFYIDCASDIILDDGENWMNLFLNADMSNETGWEGYDFILNRSRDSGTCTVERVYGTRWSDAQTVGKADYRVVGNRMVIRVSSELVCLSDRDTFDFKWADNSTISGEVMEFMDLGDAAPNDRYRFRHILAGGTSSDALLEIEAPEGSDADLLGGAWVILLICDLALAAILILALIQKRKVSAPDAEKR